MTTRAPDVGSVRSNRTTTTMVYEREPLFVDFVKVAIGVRTIFGAVAALADGAAAIRATAARGRIRAGESLIMEEVVLARDGWTGTSFERGRTARVARRRRHGGAPASGS